MHIVSLCLLLIATLLGIIGYNRTNGCTIYSAVIYILSGEISWFLSVEFRPFLQASSSV